MDLWNWVSRIAHLGKHSQLHKLEIPQAKSPEIRIFQRVEKKETLMVNPLTRTVLDTIRDCSVEVSMNTEWLASRVRWRKAKTLPCSTRLTRGPARPSSARPGSVHNSPPESRKAARNDATRRSDAQNLSNSCSHLRTGGNGTVCYSVTIAQEGLAE